MNNRELAVHIAGILHREGLDVVATVAPGVYSEVGVIHVIDAEKRPHVILIDYTAGS